VTIEPHPPEDEFYISYAPVPKSYQRFLTQFVPLLLLGIALFALVLPGLHNQFNPGKIQGKIELIGLLIDQPVPQLIVPRPGETDSNRSFSRYLLTGPGKTAPLKPVIEHVGKWVKLSGTLVSRNQLTVIAARAAEPIDPPANVILTAEAATNAGKSLGEYTLIGEILDSKCYPGVMKPGQGKTHRACAIRCISGGLPVVFRVQNDRQQVLYFALADQQGQAVNKRILDLVADPVQVTGEVIQYDDLFVLQADPASYKRVSERSL